MARKRSGAFAFTIVELLVVITIIIVLAGLILSTVGYVQKKGARSRAEAEIAGMSAACESYKADNGAYPRDPAATDTLDTRGAINLAAYRNASQFFYGQLAGDQDFDGSPDPQNKSYMQFKPATLGRRDMAQPASAGNQITYLRDPFGNSYGYSTAYQRDVDQGISPTHGYNPTFDLWSTGGVTTGADQSQWIKNW
jgi:type II secretory pathway pseudopilin PulG